MNNIKNNIGKILFVISVLLCIYMFYSQLSHVLFEIDEYFTYALIKFPLTDIITITGADVHPPLYYLILKLIIKFLNVSTIDYNLIYTLKIISIVPYIFILGISGFKIKNEYNWLTAGLFSFTLITLSEFFINYLSIRMYSWGLLFLLISFIYLKGVLEISDRKSWTLFTIFTVLGAYTHYFVALSSFILYSYLLLHIILKNRNDLKKWILSVFFAIILYIPWIPSLFNQLHTVHENYWIPQIDINYFIKCITSIAINNSDFTISTFNNLPFEIMTIFTVILLIIIAVKKYKMNSSSENLYILMGISLVIITLLIGILLSITFKPIIRVRYLVPSIAIFWFAASILIGKLKNKQILTLTLSLILILNVFCFAETIDSSFELGNNGQYEQTILNEMKNDNNSIIFTTSAGFFQFIPHINDSKLFTDTNGYLKIPDEKMNKIFNYTLVSSDEFKKIADENSNKKIYIIEPSWAPFDLKENRTFTEVHHIPNSCFTIYSN